jgi:hypothetical protein
MVKVYFNSGIGNNICVINKPDKYEMYNMSKPSDLYLSKTKVNCPNTVTFRLVVHDF